MRFVEFTDVAGRQVRVNADKVTALEDVPPGSGLVGNPEVATAICLVGGERVYVPLHVRTVDWTLRAAVSHRQRHWDGTVPVVGAER